MQTARIWTGFLLGASWVLSGCGGNDGMATVAGSVTLDGKPIETGAILFVPLDGKAPTAGGNVTNGQYSVRVPLGAMKVSISAPKVVGKKKLYDTPDSPEMPITVEALPARYNAQTELQVTVTARTAPQNFELRSQ